MRSVLGQAAVVGVGVAAAVLFIRGQLGAEPLHVQLLAVLCAGLVLGGFQLVLGRRLLRTNRLSPRQKTPPPRPLVLPEPPRQARTEGDQGWTGLARAPNRQPADARSADTLDSAPADTTPAPSESPVARTDI